MTVAILAASLAFAQPQVTVTRAIELKNPEGGLSRLMLTMPVRKTEVPRRCVAHDWEYEWLTTAFVQREEPRPGKYPRFQVFSQYRRAADDPGEAIARLLVRLWDYLDRRLGLDHAAELNHRIVDVYIAYGGKTGGEHRFEERDGKPVSSMYLYDVLHVSSRIELVRLVVGLYAAATMRPWREHTDGPNLGQRVGERILLSWLTRDVVVGRLDVGDAAGATVRQLLDARKPILGALAATALRPPDRSSFEDLAVYAATCLPYEVVGRALDRTPVDKPGEFARHVADVVSRSAESDVTWPEGNSGKPIWLPVGSARVVGGQVVERAGGWALVRANPGPVRLVGR